MRGGSSACVPVNLLVSPAPPAAQVLGRVHGAVMAALQAPPTRLPGGELVFQDWDVRHALAQERQKVGGTALDG